MTSSVAASSDVTGSDLDLNSVVVMRSEIQSAAVDDEVVLLNVEAGKYFGLDDIGSVIWNRLRSPVRVGDLCAALAAEYEGDPEEIALDVLALLTRLMGEKVIEVAA